MGILEIQKKQLPKRPGVYIFRNNAGRVLYVGKAKQLARRVMSYFQRTKTLEPAKQQMVAQIESVDTTVTKNETEALLLEATLIKRYMPPYNVVMRDDTSFMYILITTEDEYPTVMATRRVGKNAGKYFGPSTSAAAARTTVRLLKRLFAFRTCEPHRGRPCFDYHLGRCVGPCADLISPENYKRNVVEPIIQFLRGHAKEVTRNLERQMRQASKDRQFEFAASLRDRLHAVLTVTARQHMVSTTRDDTDIIGMARDRDWTAVNVFRVRRGKLLEKQNFLLQQPSGTSDTEITRSFIGQYYSRAPQSPKRICVSAMDAFARELGNILHATIAVPQRGSRFQLLKLAEENAHLYLERRQAEWFADANANRKALEHLTRALGLRNVPRRIEAYDISNIQGRHAVGSMIVFENGRPAKREYKKFTIRRTTGMPDDFAMMAEMVRRRLKHAEWPHPSLLLIDGGKGQLSAVVRIMRELGDTTPVVALAKKEEELFLPGRRMPVVLSPGSDALFLAQRIRDEAHRFAIAFYRKKHGRASVHSALNDIPGIGDKTRKSLVRTFRTPAAVRRASDAALIAVIGRRAARTVRTFFA